jgi:hypothetical protein
MIYPPITIYRRDTASKRESRYLKVVECIKSTWMEKEFSIVIDG